MKGPISDERFNLGEFVPKPDDDTIVCRCEEVTKGDVRRAVHKGLYTFNEVKKYLRTGMGLCQGQTCNRLVRAIMARELGVPVSEIDVITPRSPVRPVVTNVYANDTYNPDCLRGEENDK